MKKYKCSCGNAWYGIDEDFPECDNDDFDDAEHIVEKVKALTAKDYVELWSNELEDANRHSLTDLPEIVLEVLNKYVSDKKSIRKIMKEFYEREIGI